MPIGLARGEGESGQIDQRPTCDSVEEGRKDWAGDSRLGPCRGGLVVLEPVLEGGVDAENACQPDETDTNTC